MSAFQGLEYTKGRSSVLERQSRPLFNLEIQVGYSPARPVPVGAEKGCLRFSQTDSGDERFVPDRKDGTPLIQLGAIIICRHSVFQRLAYGTLRKGDTHGRAAGRAGQRKFGLGEFFSAVTADKADTFGVHTILLDRNRLLTEGMHLLLSCRQYV